MVHRLRHSAIALAALFAARSSVAAETSAVAIWSDRFTPPQCIEIGRIHEPAASEIKAVWMWSADAAPVRREGLDSVHADAIAPANDGRRLTVCVEGEPGLQLTLRVAPISMWEEVPETLLPAVALHVGPKGFGIVAVPVGDEPTRLRLIGRGAGSWWQDVPRGARTVRMAAAPAPDRTLTTLDEHGELVQSVRLSLLDEGAERGDFRKLADYRSDATGHLLLPALPDAALTTVVFAAADYAPLVLERRPSQLPASVTLSRGSLLTGQLVGDDGAPVRDAVVSFRGWASDELPLPLIRFGVTDARGHWKLAALPTGKGVWEARADGFAPVSRVVAIEGRSLDLGPVAISPGAVADLLVIDDRGQAVPNAAIAVAGSSQSTKTDQTGRARIRLPVNQPTVIEVTATHHLATKLSVAAPQRQERRIVLRRSFRLTGRFVDASGSAVAEGRARARHSSRFTNYALGSDGNFDLDLEPDTDYQIDFLSPRSAVAKLDVAPGAPGELRDAGDVAAPAGLVVTGRVIRADDHAPVPGARIWLPRPSESGPLMAWAFRDLLETSTGADGSFTLQGLPMVPCMLRIEAPGLAGVRRTINPRRDEAIVDLDEIVLDRGATIVVRLTEKTDDDAVAHIDLGGAGLSIDMLSAPFSGGEARLSDVPPGKVIVTALRKRDMLCRQEVDVPAGSAEIVVPCATHKTTVVGTIGVGGRPAGSGTLVWLAPVPRDLPTGVIDFGTGAARQQQVFSPESPRESAEVRPDGRFQARVLPGTWDVLWMADSGRAVGPRTVTVPEAASYFVALDYPGFNIDGVVRSAAGQGMKSAEVREVGGGAFAVTRDDGSFTLSGLAAGTSRIVARHLGASSAVAEVKLDPSGTPPFIELTLNAEQGILRISVTAPEGAAAGAMVFVESDGGRLDLASADGRGNAEVRFLPPLPSRVRAAAAFGGRWTLGEWMTWEEAVARALPLRIGKAGTALIESKNKNGPLIVTSSSGWRVDRLMQWLGTFLQLRAGSTAAIGGLPPGTYTFTVGGRERTTSIVAGEVTSIDLD